MVEAYRCVRELGRGMAGVVHEAVTPDGRRVVLKALRPQAVRQEGLVERFRREALMMAGIRHPNVMPVLDVQAEANPPFFVMPWLEGQTLASFLAERKGTLPIARILEVLRGVAAALVEIHRQGLVHRDLKPENVFLVAGGGVVVFDFGLAKRTTNEGGADLTKMGQILGTPAYMAPEQIRSAGVDGRTDVYALGILAVELLTGTNPFAHDDDVVETCRRQLVVRPERLDQLHPSRVGRALGVLIADMLAKHRTDRPQARDVLSALDHELALLSRARSRATQPSSRTDLAACAPRSASHERPVAPGQSASHEEPVAPGQSASQSASHEKPAGPRSGSHAEPSGVDVTAARERARAQLAAI